MVVGLAPDTPEVTESPPPQDSAPHEPDPLPSGILRRGAGKVVVGEGKSLIRSFTDSVPSFSPLLREPSVPTPTLRPSH